jgi:hypothetical protein
LILEFIIKNFFYITRLLLGLGVVLIAFAVMKKENNNKSICSEVINDNTNMIKNHIVMNKENSSKSNRLLIGAGLTAIILGIVLFVVVVAAIIIGVYIFYLISKLG